MVIRMQHGDSLLQGKSLMQGWEIVTRSGILKCFSG